MSYSTVAEADACLGGDAAWAALSSQAKQARLDGAALWLGASYRGFDGAHLPEVYDSTPDSVPLIKMAEQIAARWALTVSLFAEPGNAASQGAVTRKKTKVDVLEIETVWAEPERESDGRLVIGEVDAILTCWAARVGTEVRTSMMFTA